MSAIKILNNHDVSRDQKKKFSQQIIGYLVINNKQNITT